jgi:diguanylate cyclase (GGDEF)-like protein
MALWVFSMVAMAHPEREISSAAIIDDIVDRSLPLRAWPQDFRELYLSHATKRLLADGKFQLRLGLLVCLSTMAIDLLIYPEMAFEGALLRSLLVAPLTLLGLFAVAKGMPRATQLFLGSSMILFACVVVHLGTHLPAEFSPRYMMVMALMPAVANIILPLPPRSLVHFCVAFILATFITVAASDPAELLRRLDYFLIMVFSSMATIPIVQRLELLNRQNFLFNLRHRLDAEELVEANRLLHELSERDPLTGMPNRRCFERVFSEGCDGTPEREVERIALMMIDLDHFKSFNDRHGHQAGDQCLRLVSSALTRVFGNCEGLVARYGGEEFIGILKEAEPGAALALAEEARAAIESLPGRRDGQPLITASIGLAITPGAVKFSREDMIEMADAALYSAKRAGRNRVEIVEAGVPCRLRA